MSGILRPARYVISEEGEFEIVGNPFIWLLLDRRRSKWEGKSKIGRMDMGFEDEIGLAHSSCMAMSGSIAGEVDT